MLELESENTDGKYTKVMFTYLPDFSKQDQHSSIYICERCNLLFDKIINEKVSAQMDYIIETIKDEIIETVKDEIEDFGNS